MFECNTYNLDKSINALGFRWYSQFPYGPGPYKAVVSYASGVTVLMQVYHEGMFTFVSLEFFRGGERIHKEVGRGATSLQETMFDVIDSLRMVLPHVADTKAREQAYEQELFCARTSEDYSGLLKMLVEEIYG